MKDGIYKINLLVVIHRKKIIPKGGTHGYDNQLKSMHALFLASGPAFQLGIQIEPFENVNIYPLICEILNITPHPNIDGKLNDIRHILR